jgi:UDP-glucose 4-epimerase
VRVAVTGGIGCLGMPLIDKLLKSRIEIRLLVRPHDRTAKQLGGRIQIITGNLSSNDVLTTLTEGCDVVFHLAGKVHAVPKTKNEEDEFYRVNVDGTRNLIQACAENQVQRMIFYSTMGVYGKEGDFHGDELSLCEPVSVYAKSKHNAERIVLHSKEKGGPQGAVLRFPVVYGPLDRGNVLKLIRVIAQKRFFYFGDGRCLRSMISSVNAAEAAVKAAFVPFAGSQVFCVTDGQDYQLLELVDTICASLCTTWRPIHVPISAARQMGKIGDLFEKITRITSPISSATVAKLSSSLTFSCEKAKSLLRYEPVETLSEGISREVAWLRSIR